MMFLSIDIFHFFNEQSLKFVTEKAKSSLCSVKSCRQVLIFQANKLSIIGMVFITTNIAIGASFLLIADNIVNKMMTLGQ
jgi:hypothetical protein